MALNLRSTEAIIETTEKLGVLVLAQKIPFQAMQAINGGISNILRIYCPSGGATQTVQVNMEAANTITLDELTSALGSLPLETQDLVINALKQQRIGISAGSQAQPIQVR